MKSVLKTVTVSCSFMMLLGAVFMPAVARLKVDAVSLHAVNHLQQGKVKVRRGDYKGAIADFTQEIQINPKSTEAYISRGLAHHDLEDFKKAIADFNQALILEPKNDQALYRRGEARTDTEDFQGAFSDINQAIQINPRYAEAYNHRAMLYGEFKGDLKRALSDLNQAIQLKPTYADAYYNRGKALSDLGKYRGAVADYTRAIALNPDLAEAYGSRGSLRAQLGEKKAGLQDLKQAASIFSQQNNPMGYQQTLILIQQIQQLPNPNVTRGLRGVKVIVP